MSMYPDPKAISAAFARLRIAIIAANVRMRRRHRANGFDPHREWRDLGGEA